MKEEHPLYQALRANLREGITPFAKLQRKGDPYVFDHFATDRSGSECMYYSFHLRNGQLVCFEEGDE